MLFPSQSIKDLSKMFWRVCVIGPQPKTGNRQIIQPNGFKFRRTTGDKRNQNLDKTTANESMYKVQTPSVFFNEKNIRLSRDTANQKSNILFLIIFSSGEEYWRMHTQHNS